MTQRVESIPKVLLVCISMRHLALVVLDECQCGRFNESMGPVGLARWVWGDAIVRRIVFCHHSLTGLLAF